MTPSHVATAQRTHRVASYKLPYIAVHMQSGASEPPFRTQVTHVHTLDGLYVFSVLQTLWDKPVSAEIHTVHVMIFNDFGYAF
jgi:hypothetical protein